jgi:hypothetical protein
MNLWAKAQKTLINAGTDVELPSNFQQQHFNTHCPYRNDSIINTVNIDEDIVTTTTELSHFIRQKMKMILL